MLQTLLPPLGVLLELRLRACAPALFLVQDLLAARALLVELELRLLLLRQQARLEAQHLGLRLAHPLARLLEQLQRLRAPLLRLCMSLRLGAQLALGVEQLGRGRIAAGNAPGGAHAAALRWAAASAHDRRMELLVIDRAARIAVELVEHRVHLRLAGLEAEGHHRLPELGLAHFAVAVLVPRLEQIRDACVVVLDARLQRLQVKVRVVLGVGVGCRHVRRRRRRCGEQSAHLVLEGRHRAHVCS